MVASMMASGVTIICTDAASTPGKMEESTRVSTSTIVNMDSVSTHGRTVVSTRVTGTTASNTATVSTVKLVVPKDVDAGKRASAATGTTSSKTWINLPRPNKYEQKLLTMTKNLENAGKTN